MGQEPMVVFDRKKPESYWDDFLVDLLVVLLPYFGLAVGLGVFAGVGVWLNQWLVSLLILPVALFGLGMVVKTVRLPWKGVSASDSGGPARTREGVASAADPSDGDGDGDRERRSWADLQRRLRDARQDGDSVPRLQPAFGDLEFPVRVAAGGAISGEASA